MRSRLEARWAALLDIIGVRWDYEPIVLDRYVPDFLVHSYFHADPVVPGPILLEVRPYLKPAEYAEARVRIAQSGWAGPAIVAGGTLDVEDTAWGRESSVGYGHPAVVPEHAAAASTAWFKVGWCDGRWGMGGRDLTREWREAGNRVRYMPPR